MAQLKRKDGPTNESFVRTKTTFDSDGRPQKRARKSEEGLAEKVGSKDTTSKPTSTIKDHQPPKISKLKEEDAAFPRGGASVLTPLEHKQIQIEATRDVLFEQQNGSGPTTEAGGPAKKRKSKSKGKKEDEVAVAEETIKVEGLSYKRIVPGSLVLGQVSQINAHDIALALPNNLTGYVPITSISQKLTERIEKLVGVEDDNEDSDAEDDQEEDIVLKDLFTLGQYLRAYVTSVTDGSTNNGTTKAKRRIELSLDPRRSNSGLSPKELVINAMVMASVVSVEDHGLVMSLGLDSNELKGFMSSKEIGNHVDFSKVQEGAVYMCMVTGLSSNGKIVKLSADTQKIANLKKGNFLADAPTVDAFLPGTAVEVLVEEATSKGISGKVMGMLDVTADLMHSGASASTQDIEKKYKVGSKVKGRIICTFPNSEPKKLGISLLDHVLALGPQLSLQKDGKKTDPLEVLPISSIVESVTVRKVQPGIGLFVDIGVKGVPGFVHISRIADKKVDILTETTGPYKVGSAHRGRVIGYNILDGVFLVSLEPSTIEQPFLRIEDLKIGEIVKGKVEKIVVNDAGVGGLLVNLADDITGLVPEMHMADVKLLHPERKFKEGMVVTARVLSTDVSKRQIRLTLKKTLVNSDSPVFKTYDEISPGMQSPGTLVNILPTGAVVQFLGTVRGFLPVGEMSEAYIADPNQHFRIGQVVNVHVLSVDPEAGKLLVSCKDPSAFGLVQQTAMKNLKIGQLVCGSVTEKSSDDVSIELEASSLRATLPVQHLTDNSEQKNLSALKKIRVGQRLVDLVVLEKMDRSHTILVSNKPSLVKSAKEGTLISEFGDVKEDMIVHGFVSNVTGTAVYVKFPGGLTGLLPKTEVTADKILLPDFGLRKFQSLTTRVLALDNDQQRFLLSMNLDHKSQTREQNGQAGDGIVAVNPADESISSPADLSEGRLTKATISSIKNTQLNVQIADNIQGRVDVSQVFDSWDDIKDRKHPLKIFTRKQVINVKVLGIHDARNHRFLPLSHRGAKNQVFELSAKPSDQTEKKYEPPTLDQIEVGSSWIAFVNNISDDCVWVNLSPNVRGRIRTLDLSEDVSQLTDINANFPIGSAIKVHVKSVDVRSSRLDLSARSAESSKELTLETLTQGMVLPGKVTKVTERQVMVQLSEDISGPVFLTDLSDDFEEANTTKYSKNDIIRVCITSIDLPNKKLRLSARPSRVLNSSLPVRDPEIDSIEQLKVNDIVRGFVKNVADNGLFVQLGGNVTAYIRISDISDSFVKDWKSIYQVDQLVKGKVIRCDPDINHVQLSLKPSVLDKDYVAPITYHDLAVGQLVTGKVRKVEDFGVFIVVDGSANVSGLCHKSEMADKRVADVRQLYDEGDVVKAVILKVDPVKKRISFGLKASYFEGNEDESEDEDGDEDGEDDEDDAMQGVLLEGMSSDDEDDEDGGIELDQPEDIGSEAGESDEDMGDAPDKSEVATLDAGGFDWTADNIDEDADNMDVDSEGDGIEKRKKKKHRKPVIRIDRTGDLDAKDPQSVGDFERLLLGQPDSADLWIKYMAFQMNLSEVSKAREIAERAIRTINMREEGEKLNVWTALLNLEVTYGSDQKVQETFARACQYNDSQEVHEILISIYIQSGKHEKADALFQILTKKFKHDPSVWINYAHFQMNTLQNPEGARALLPRATIVIPPNTLLNLTQKFASLEFKSPSGSPERGRTIFEGLVSTYPKNISIWSQLLDLEIQQGEKDTIRRVFERVAKVEGMKPKGMMAWFKRWVEWEERNGGGKEKLKAEARAEEWVRLWKEKKERRESGGEV